MNGTHNIGFSPLPFKTATLETEIANIMQYHVGRKKAIRGKRLLARIRDNKQFAATNEREMRAAIAELRKTGAELILSTGGIRGGYWLAATPDEVDEFVAAEIDARAFDLLETKKAMMRAAAERFSLPREQGRMF